jgi:hypothetical protein
MTNYVDHFLDAMLAVCQFHRSNNVREIMKVVTDVESKIEEFRGLRGRLSE